MGFGVFVGKSSSIHTARDFLGLIPFISSYSGFVSRKEWVSCMYMM